MSQEAAFFTEHDLVVLREQDKPYMLVEYAGLCWLINRSVNGYTVSCYKTENREITYQKTHWELAKAEEIVMCQVQGAVIAMAA